MSSLTLEDQWQKYEKINHGFFPHILYPSCSVCNKCMRAARVNARMACPVANTYKYSFTVHVVIIVMLLFMVLLISA
jgi:MinD superfamily P-loop ATPase